MSMGESGMNGGWVYRGQDMGQPPKQKRSAPPLWAQRITKVRKDAGLSQTMFGKKLGLSQSAISDWESGKAEPNFSQVIDIIRVTGADPAWLLIGDDPSRGDTYGALIAEVQKKNGNFAWVFAEAAKLFAEEGIKADLGFLVSYTHKILSAAGEGSDDASAKEAIFRKLEDERAELRQDLDQIRKKRM